MTILTTNKLSKHYEFGEHLVCALSDLDFHVAEGEFVAIMGPSGSGKSTLLHLLGGLDTPTEGVVFLRGKPFSNLSDKDLTLARRHHIGFVFQFFNLLPTLTATENILLPVLIDDQNADAYSSRLKELLVMVGLDKRGNHKPDQLSGGEQQRVAVARALITQPDILLADEPTGNLDSKAGKVIMELLRQSCDRLNQTIVVVTHDPRAAAYADRIVFLRDGKIEHQLHLSNENQHAIKIQKIMKVMESLEE